MLTTEPPPCDGPAGEALLKAAEGGHEDVVVMLLTWPQHAPTADCRDGQALVRAAKAGHEGMVRL